MYRVGLEGILGFTKRGDTLFITPRTPISWAGYTIEYRYGKSVYEIVVRNETGEAWGAVELTVDGRSANGAGIILVDDGQRHQVTVTPLAESAPVSSAPVEEGLSPGA